MLLSRFKYKLCKKLLNNTVQEAEKEAEEAEAFCNETSDCNTYISCQMKKNKKITYNALNDKFEYDDLELFSLGNKNAVRLDKLAWKKIKELMVNHNKKKI